MKAATPGPQGPAPPSPDPTALRLLGRASSINVRKVLWTCDELGLAVQHEAWGEGALSLRSPEFLALNPGGLVPVLVHQGLVLRESNTICRYLAQAFGDGRLLPAAATDRARVEQWMDWQATELNNAWRYAFMALVRRSPAHQDATAVRHSLQQWHGQMALLEAALAAGGPHVCGDSFTLADVVLALSTQRWLKTPGAEAGVERPSLPAVAAWMDRLRTRPGFARHVDNGQP